MDCGRSNDYYMLRTPLMTKLADATQSIDIIRINLHTHVKNTRGPTFEVLRKQKHNFNVFLYCSRLFII